ncbi:MAG: ROK family protein [Vicinamibacterales bacterium]|nr:ROK family protein [Vicinamibacterales bacterium]
MSRAFCIGIDVGGTKIAGVALDAQGSALASRRMPTPRGSYEGTIAGIAGLVASIEDEIGAEASVGVGIPGSLSPASGQVQNANSTWLNGRSLGHDLSERLDRPVRIANDANCFALSEAVDGAGRGGGVVFGVILGTGCGGGLVVDGKLVNGPMGISGEWGHNPLPWAEADETPGPQCWCGRRGCIETWVSGPALSRDHQEAGGETLSAEAIVERAESGNGEAQHTLDRHVSRLARALGGLMNIVDPDIIVLGGGLSQMGHLYDRLPGQVAAHVFADTPIVRLEPPHHGPASGVRGAAWLWGSRHTNFQPG